MDDWQSNYISEILPCLLKQTRCNTNFLSILKSEKVLGEADLDTLDALAVKGNHAQISEVFRILVTRHGAYDKVIRALDQTNQTGARNLLLKGYKSHPNLHPPFDFPEEESASPSEHVDELFSKNVTMNGRLLLLSEVCKGIEPPDLKQIINQSVDNELRLAIMNDINAFNLIEKTIPETPAYYVARKLTKRARLKVELLQESSQDIFLVKGVTLADLTELVSPNFVLKSRDQLNKISVRYIVCEEDDHFNIICEQSRSNANIHFLQYQDGELSWIDSRGNIEILFDYIHKDQTHLEEEALFQELMEPSALQHAVCIADTPGMGKTVLLTKIAERINSLHKSSLVLFFVLREFSQYLPSSTKEITGGRIEELIATQVTTAVNEKNLLGKELVLHFLRSPDHRVEICFDGFDEVLDTQVQTTKKLLKVVKNEFKNTRVLVTTRPHLRKELEETLGVLGYNMLPFQENDQIKFLLNFWKPQTGQSETLENFASLCLKTLKEKMSSGEEDIAGVPLQCRLLGEIYLEQAGRLQKSPDVEKEPMVASIFEMYCKLMSLRFQGNRLKQSNFVIPGLGVGKYLRHLKGKHLWAKKMKQVHILAAVEVLFPEILDTVKETFPLDHNKYLLAAYKLGLIEEKRTFKSNYRFIHRTYAEFVVAEFLVDVITAKLSISKKKSNFWKHLLQLLFTKIFKSQNFVEQIIPPDLSAVNALANIAKFDNFVIPYFINGHLKNKTVSDVDLIDLYQYLLAMSFNNSIYENILVSCTVANLENLFRLLIVLCKTIKMDKFTLPQELLVAAAKYSDFDFNRIVHKLFASSVNVEASSSGKSVFVACMETAIRRGNYSIVQVILYNYKAASIHRNLLHICLYESTFDKFDTILDKLEIIKLILKHSPSLREEKIDSDESTPILQPFANIELIQFLLERGANVNAVSKSNDNILHRFLKTRNHQRLEEHILIDFLQLIKKFQFNGYHTANANGDIPIGRLFQAARVGRKTLEFFQSEGVDFTFKNKSGENLLFTAILNHQSHECLKQLICQGLDCKNINVNSDSLLHTAAELGNREVVEFLLCHDNSLVDNKNISQNTPLHIAFTKQTNSHRQIQEMLLLHGGNLLTPNAEGYIPIEYGLEHSSSLAVTVEKLEKYGTHGFIPCKEKASKLLRAIFMNPNVTRWGIQGDFRGLVQHLLSIGGRVMCDNGKNPINNKSLQHCISCIAKSLQTKYLANATQESGERECKIFEIVADTVLDKNGKVMLNNLRNNEISMEYVVFVLLCIGDNKNLSLLIKAYQLVQSKSTRFTNTALREFYQGADAKECLIFSDCIPLTIAKIQEQIDPMILIVDMTTFEKISDQLKQDVVVLLAVSEATLPDKCFPLLIDKQYSHNIIFIQEWQFQDSTPIFEQFISMYEDEYHWDSLSSSVQNQLLCAFQQFCYSNACERNGNVEYLEPMELLNSNAIPTIFLLPQQVLTVFKGLFNDPNIYKNLPTMYAALQEHGLRKLFPNMKENKAFTEEDTIAANKLKEYLYCGPTFSYLIAAWILNHAGEVNADEIKIRKELFECHPSQVDVFDTVNKTKIVVKTYVFKYWLIMYFVNKLSADFSFPRGSIFIPEFYIKQMHACINLDAVNLLNIIRHKPSIDDDMLLIATERGNADLLVYSSALIA